VSLQIALTHIEGDVGLLKGHTSVCFVQDAVIRVRWLLHLLRRGRHKVASEVVFFEAGLEVGLMFKAPVVGNLVVVDLLLVRGYEIVLIVRDWSGSDLLKVHWVGVNLVESGAVRDFAIAHVVEQANDAEHGG
jgi:hypothetical protein